jgi:choline-sulfatase
MSTPNVLILIADQLAAGGVGCYGQPHARTVHVDQLARDGICFSRAYSNCPLCTPSRTSFWSGRYPHETGVLSNGKMWPNPTIPEGMTTLGDLATAAGYRAIHVGKESAQGALRGFELRQTKAVRINGPAAFPYNADTWKDEGTTREVCALLEGGIADRFLLVADLVNPHNICGWVGENEGAEDRLDVPQPWPPLPDNFEDMPDLLNRPRPVQYVCCAHRRQQQTALWPKHKFQQYLAAYHHYAALADACIGRILEALRRSGKAEDTLIVFLSDHGDGMTAHRLVTKHTTFYDETTRVPLILSGAGVRARGVAAGDPLVSLLDVLPTLAEAMGAKVPGDLHGQSFAAAMRGEPMPHPHDAVVSQWHTEWGYTVEPGRMLRTERFKYIRYLEGHGEELYDMVADPGEKRNLIGDAGFASVAEAHRQRMAEYLSQTNDPFETLTWQAAARWRSHAVGYGQHEGPCATMVEEDGN